MQVDPIKHTLKAPGPKYLNLEYDLPLSNVALKFNLRRFSVANNHVSRNGKDGIRLGDTAEAGAYTRPLFSST